MNFNQKLISWLFETDALRVCPENKPFFYTSGTIGPYYINTHFLYGSEASANALLKKIDSQLEGGKTVSASIAAETEAHYKAGGVYRELMDGIAEVITREVGTENFDYISGGERRDWFFSFTAAQLLGKPHITIFKDKSCEIYYPVDALNPEIEGARVLHISDLITEASSYDRAWIPAIEELGAKMPLSLSVVDRLQGGRELLQGHGARQISLIEVGKELFDEALAIGKITKDQYDMIIAYIKDPTAAMEAFLKDNPEFLQNALNSDERTRARAELLLSSGVYKI